VWLEMVGWLLPSGSVGLVDDQDGCAAAFGVLGGQGVARLGDEHGGMEAEGLAEGGDDGVADAAGASGGVADVDGEVAVGVEGCEGGAGGDGLADADFAGDDAEGFPDTAQAIRADASPWLAWRCSMPGRDCAERHAGEPVEALELAED
jgi:hypothetical protein